MRNLAKLLILLVVIYLIIEMVSGKSFDYKSLLNTSSPSLQNEKVKVVSEESVVIDVVKKVGPSVITVGEEQTAQSGRSLGTDPFSIFFNQPPGSSSGTPQDQYIGSGFVVSSDGLVVTNKHVVSDRGVNYFIVDQKGNKYKVSNVYRDPSNDIAVLKITNAPLGGFPKVELGDSSKLQVGQKAIAIGTALGEFRNTVTTGVISGLGRGITAGSPFEGYVERLDNVIQTDAAINPGNSGGPLLNSAGQVIGINSAIASNGENIGFAIPINIVKDSLKNFNQTGQFNRPYLGVTYSVISQKAAIANEVPEGAYVQAVTPGSPAEKSGIQDGDIITKIDGQKVNSQSQGLANYISRKKVGDAISLEVYRNGKTTSVKATLEQTTGE